MKMTDAALRVTERANSSLVPVNSDLEFLDKDDLRENLMLKPKKNFIAKNMRIARNQAGGKWESNLNVAAVLNLEPNDEVVNELQKSVCSVTQSTYTS